MDTKIKLIRRSSSKDLEEAVNSFLVGKLVTSVDVQQTSFDPQEYIATIIYLEGEPGQARKLDEEVKIALFKETGF